MTAALTAAALALVLGACGDGGGDAEPGGLPDAGGGGVLAYALPELPRTLDPLAAESRVEQVVSRQVHEPLVSRQRPPYGTAEAGGGAEPQPGLALAVEPADDRTVWRVTLRPGVLFQDGSPFNASAVLANARRWTETGAAGELLPGLFAVDAPRPDEVRFLFRRSRAGVPALLASPRLGIVSPQALAAEGGERRAAVPLAPGSGTGPFALGERSRDRVVLARNEQWWGSAAGLGPALDAVDFVRIPGPVGRLGALTMGEVQVAEPFESTEVAAASGETLVRIIPLGAGQGFAAMEGSVRGLVPGPRVRALSGVWLTRIGA